MSIEYAAYESGLDRFVHPEKGDFIGKDALLKWKLNGIKNKLVTLEVHDVTNADVLGNNPIYIDGKLIGRATGGEYGFRINKSLALAMIKTEFTSTGQELEIDILGKKHKATVIPDSPYDPENVKLRS